MTRNRLLLLIGAILLSGPASATYLLSGSGTYDDGSTITWSTSLPDSYTPNTSWNHNATIDGGLVVNATVASLALNLTQADGLYVVTPSQGNLWLAFNNAQDPLAGISGWIWNFASFPFIGAFTAGHMDVSQVLPVVINTTSICLYCTAVILQSGLSQLTVPEPASIALMGLGLAGLGFSRRNKAK